MISDIHFLHLWLLSVHAPGQQPIQTVLRIMWSSVPYNMYLLLIESFCLHILPSKFFCILKRPARSFQLLSNCHLRLYYNYHWNTLIVHTDIHVIFTHNYNDMDTCMYKWTYTHVHIHMHAHKHTHTHTHTHTYCVKSSPNLYWSSNILNCCLFTALTVDCSSANSTYSVDQ